MKDYYSILEIDLNAGETLIRSQYRKLASIYHPDKNPDNQNKFIYLNEAYKTLIDPALRESYDKDLKEYNDFKKIQSPDSKITPYRTRFRDGGSVNITVDFTEDLNNLKNKGKLKKESKENFEFIEKKINIEKHIKCPECEGEGKNKGTIAMVCPKCRSTGTVKNSISKINEVCGNCNGYGDIFLYKCKICNAMGRIRKVEEIKLNFSVSDLLSGKNIIVFEGHGDAGVFGGKDGNLNVSVKIDHDMLNKMNKAGKSFFTGFFKKKFKLI
jgi:molecular chaperone DnaJ